MLLSGWMLLHGCRASLACTMLRLPLVLGNPGAGAVQATAGGHVGSTRCCWCANRRCCKRTMPQPARRSTVEDTVIVFIKFASRYKDISTLRCERGRCCTVRVTAGVWMASSSPPAAAVCHCQVYLLSETAAMFVSGPIFSVVDLPPRTVSHKDLQLSKNHAESRQAYNSTWACGSNRSSQVRHTGMGQLTGAALWPLPLYQ